MAEDQYEKDYGEALAVLDRRGKTVSMPTFDRDGIRHCLISGFPLADREVLEEAWGRDLAEEILSARTMRVAVPDCCAECQRLWREYTDLTKLCVKTLIEQQRAGSSQDSTTLANAAEYQQNARILVRDHAATHVAKIVAVH